MNWVLANQCQRASERMAIPILTKVTHSCYPATMSGFNVCSAATLSLFVPLVRLVCSQDAMLRQLQQQIVALQAQLAALSAASAAHKIPDAELSEHSHDQVRPRPSGPLNMQCLRKAQHIVHGPPSRC